MNINSEMFQFFNNHEYSHLQPSQSLSWVASFEEKHVLFDEVEKIDLLKPYMWDGGNDGGEAAEREKLSANLRREEAAMSSFSTESLFWSVFFGVFGMKEYSAIHKKANREMEEKQKIIEFIQKNPEKIKKSNHKTTKTMMQEIMSELLSNREISIQSLIVFSVFYKTNIYLIKKNVYCVFKCCDGDEPVANVFIFESMTKKAKKSYSVEFAGDGDKTASMIRSIEQNCFFIENIKKTLKAASFYKVSCLEKIASKFNMDVAKYKTKKDLYDALLESENLR